MCCEFIKFLYFSFIFIFMKSGECAVVTYNKPKMVMTSFIVLKFKNISLERGVLLASDV